MSLSIPILALLACAAPEDAPPPAPPAPTLALTDAWTVKSTAADAMLLGTGTQGDGVRVQLARDARGRLPGVSPIARGDTLDVADGADHWPLVAVAYPDEALSAVSIRSEGPDLVVDLAGPPLSTKRPDAPADPVLTRVRLRPRGDSWRVVVDGLATISLPGSATAVAHSDGTATITAGALTAALDPHEPPIPLTSDDDGSRWSLSTHGALDVHEPYVRTALTLRP